MFIVIVYDVEVGRVNKVMKLLRQYLDHVQNSVFEGEVQPSTLMEIKNKLKRVIDEDCDSIVIYKTNSPKNLNKEVLGIEKRNIDRIV